MRGFLVASLSKKGFCQRTTATKYKLAIGLTFLQSAVTLYYGG